MCATDDPPAAPANPVHLTGDRRSRFRAGSNVPPQKHQRARRGLRTPPFPYSSTPERARAWFLRLRHHLSLEERFLTVFSRRVGACARPAPPIQKPRFRRGLDIAFGRGMPSIAQKISSSEETNRGYYSDLPAFDQPARARRSGKKRDTVLRSVAPADGEGPDVQTRVPRCDVHTSAGCYLQSRRRYPLLNREEEHQIALEYVRTGDNALANR